MIKFLIPLLVCVTVEGQIVLSGGRLNGSVLGTTNLTSGGGGGGTTSTDNFIRADASPISNPMSDGSSTWTTIAISGWTVAKINSNQAEGTGGGWSMAQVATPAFSANQTNTITIQNAANLNIGVGARMQSDGGGYAVVPNGSTQIRIYKTSTGQGFANQLNITVATLATSETISCAAVGTTIYAMTNGVVAGSISDSTFSSGQPAILVQQFDTISLFVGTCPP